MQWSSISFDLKIWRCGGSFEAHQISGAEVLRKVGHRVLLRSEHIVLLRSFKARNVHLHSFFEFLATYETQKNDAFFCILFLRM